MFLLANYNIAFVLIKKINFISDKFIINSKNALLNFFYCYGSSFEKRKLQFKK